MKTHNPAASVDAPTHVSLRSLRLGRRATDQHHWAALPFMRIRYAVLFCVILSTGAFGARAQAPSPSHPFDLAVTNISIASVRLSMTNVVAFHFADARFGVDNVDELDQELAKSGIHSKRLIRVMEGTNVLAESRLYGRAWGIHANGFLLHFHSPEAAQKAAAVMQDKGALVLPKTLEIERDRKAWTVY